MSKDEKLGHAFPVQVVTSVVVVLVALLIGIVIGINRGQSSESLLEDEDIAQQEEVSGEFDQTISLIDQPSGKVREGECGMRYYYHEEADGRQTLVILLIGSFCTMQTSNYVEAMGGFFPWLPADTNMATVVSGGLSGYQLPPQHTFYCDSRITQVAVRVGLLSPERDLPAEWHTVLLTHPC